MVTFIKDFIKASLNINPDAFIFFLTNVIALFFIYFITILILMLSFNVKTIMKSKLTLILMFSISVALVIAFIFVNYTGLIMDNNLWYLYYLLLLDLNKQVYFIILIFLYTLALILISLALIKVIRMSLFNLLKYTCAIICYFLFNLILIFTYIIILCYVLDVVKLILFTFFNIGFFFISYLKNFFYLSSFAQYFYWVYTPVCYSWMFFLYMCVYGPTIINLADTLSNFIHGFILELIPKRWGLYSYFLVIKPIKLLFVIIFLAINYFLYVGGLLALTSSYSFSVTLNCLDFSFHENIYNNVDVIKNTSILKMKNYTTPSDKNSNCSGESSDYFSSDESDYSDTSLSSDTNEVKMLEKRLRSILSTAKNPKFINYSKSGEKLLSLDQLTIQGNLQDIKNTGASPSYNSDLLLIDTILKKTEKRHYKSEVAH